MGRRPLSSRETIFLSASGIILFKEWSPGAIQGACANWVTEQNLLLGKMGLGVRSRSIVSLCFVSSPGWAWEPDFTVQRVGSLTPYKET